MSAEPLRPRLLLEHLREAEVVSILVATDLGDHPRDRDDLEALEAARDPEGHQLRSARLLSGGHH